MAHLRVSCLLAAHALLTNAFHLQPLPTFNAPSNTISSTTNKSSSTIRYHLTTRRTSPLHGKAWDKLGIEEDPLSEPSAWYLMNCVVSTELALLAQARHTTRDLPTTLVEKLVVPTGRHLRSHGKRNVVEVKVAYPGYVFCKMRLTVETYEALQALPLCRSWMAGTVNLKGYTKLPPAPIALSDDEVEKFRGLQEETEDMYLKRGEDYTGKGDRGEDLLGQYATYEVEDYVKVLSGNFQGEDGVVRRLKDGNIAVRLYTYGSALDQWFKPTELRKMNELEVAKGLTGGAAINQDTFDVSIGKKTQAQEREEAQNDRRQQNPRSNLMAGVSGGGGNTGRERRQDRMSRGETGRTDIYGRSDKEAKKEEDNWKQYREKQRDQQQQAKKKVGDTWGMKENSSWSEQEKNREDVADALDADSGWGSLTEAASPPSKDSPEDDFFNSLMSELSDNLDSPNKKQTTGAGAGAGQKQVDDGDDFFSSLMSDLSESMDQTTIESDTTAQSSKPAQPNNNSAPGSNAPTDDFFADLESDLSTQQTSGGTTEGDAEDDFFASLVTDLNKSLNNNDSPASTNVERASSVSTSPSDKTEGDLEDDFFASLEADMSKSIGSSTTPGSKDVEDDFFASLETDLTEFFDSSNSETNDSPTQTKDDTEDDFFASLETDLGNMLTTDTAPTSPPSPPTDTNPRRETTPPDDRSAPNPTTSDSAEDDFFATLVSDLSDSLSTSDRDDRPKDTAPPPARPAPKTTTPDRAEEQIEDDFFSSLESELSDMLTVTEDAASPPPSSSSPSSPLKEDGATESEEPRAARPNEAVRTKSVDTVTGDDGDLSKMTVVVLKQILRDRGLKVSGKKSELIERLQQ